MKDKTSRFDSFIKGEVIEMPGPGQYEAYPSIGMKSIPTKAATKIKRHGSIPQLKILRTIDPSSTNIA